MNVRDFQYLTAIGKHGSISKAAQELYLSQPALSKFLQRLEQECGTPLFQHVGKSLVPTYAGEYCLEKAEEILYLHDQITNRCTDIAQLLRGRIKLGLPMSRTNYFLAQILPIFYRDFPGIHVSLEENATSVLLKKVQTGELDLIFVNVNSSEPRPGLVYDLVSHEEMVLAAPTSYRLNAAACTAPSSAYPCLPLEHWADLPFIMLARDQATRTFIDAYFQSHQITPNIILRIRNLGQALNAVRNGIGITISPSIPPHSEDENHLISYFSLPDCKQPFLRQTAIVYREDSYLSQAAEGLIQIIRRVHESL